MRANDEGCAFMCVEERWIRHAICISQIRHAQSRNVSVCVAALYNGVFMHPHIRIIAQPRRNYGPYTWYPWPPTPADASDADVNARAPNESLSLVWPPLIKILQQRKKTSDVNELELKGALTRLQPLITLIHHTSPVLFHSESKTFWCHVLCFHQK